MRRQIKLLLAVVCFGLSVPARAWDPNKPFIYEMRIAFETDNWINMYSTATVLSKSDNREAFRVVANSTTTPTYQLVVTTQGYVGISTGNPQAKFHVSGGDSQFGDGSASTISASGYMTFANLSSTPTASAGRIYYDSSASKLRLSTGSSASSWTDLAAASASGDLSVTGSLVGIDSYTKLLLHMNGTDATTTFIDSATGKTVINSNATIKTDYSKFGGAAGRFNGTISCYLSLANSADFAFGSGDFTVECWIRKNANDTYQYVIHYGDGTDGSKTSFYIKITDGNTISGVLYLNNGDHMYSATSVRTITDTNWHHIALVRNGINLTLYIDGTADGTIATLSTLATNAVANPLVIGGLSNFSNYYYNGWIDEVRISKGVARWTSDFTPPTREYGSVLAGDVAASSLILRATDGTNCYRLTVNNSGAQTTTLVPCP